MPKKHRDSKKYLKRKKLERYKIKKIAEINTIEVIDNAPAVTYQDLVQIKSKEPLKKKGLYKRKRSHRMFKDRYVVMFGKKVSVPNGLIGCDCCGADILTKQIDVVFTGVSVKPFALCKNCCEDYKIWSKRFNNPMDIIKRIRDEQLDPMIVDSLNKAII